MLGLWLELTVEPMTGTLPGAVAGDGELLARATCALGRDKINRL
jgi:hypothetical protein